MPCGQNANTFDKPASAVDDHTVKSVSTLLVLVCAFILSANFLWAEKAPAKQYVPPPSGIKGNDDRQRVDIRAYPWSTIGRLNKDGNFCTGLLVGKNKILTAAHCFWNKRTRQWSAATQYHFVVGYDKGKYAAHAKGVSYKTAFRKLPDLAKITLKRADDWAILTLDKPLGQEFGFIAISDFSPKTFLDRNMKKGRIIQAGYSRDFAHVLTVHKNCSLDKFVRLSKSEEPVFLHQCDATRGDSGSPIFYNLNGKYSLIAIHSATSRLISGRVTGIAVPAVQYGQFVNN